MTTTTRLDEVRHALKSRKFERVQAALREAIAGGQQFELLLIEFVEHEKGGLRVVAAGALGDLPRSDAGDRALRAAFQTRGSQTQDFRCAALTSLAKRNRADATPELQMALHDSDGVIREFALIGLAATGDERATEAVFTWLDKRLRKPTRTNYGDRSPTLAAIDYLFRVVADPPGLWRLLGLLRRHWLNLKPEEAQEVERIWPGAAPSGPPANEMKKPDRGCFHDWDAWLSSSIV